MALHDHVASTVALARLLRDGLDDRESVSIKAGTLRLILDVLIEVGDPPASRRRERDAQRIVASSLAQLSVAMEAAGKVFDSELDVIAAKFEERLGD